MPTAAPKPCTHPGCGALVRDGSSRCAAHPHAGRFADKRRGSRHQRDYGSAWVKRRARILERDAGLCQPCLREGVTTPGCNEVDHVIPRAEGGTEDDGNLQAICRPCHQAKTAAEAARGASAGGAAAPRGKGGQILGAWAAGTDPQAEFLRAQVSGVGGVSTPAVDQVQAAAPRSA